MAKRFLLHYCCFIFVDNFLQIKKKIFLLTNSLSIIDQYFLYLFYLSSIYYYIYRIHSFINKLFYLIVTHISVYWWVHVELSTLSVIYQMSAINWIYWQWVENLMENWGNDTKLLLILLLQYKSYILLD